jgi:hypothetical protein
MASFLFNRYGKEFALGDRSSGTISLVDDTIKVVLLTSAASPDQDVDFMTTYTATELSCTGYTAGYGGAGRLTLAATKAWSHTSTTAVFDSTGDLTWTACGAAYAGAAVKYILLIKEITSDAASPCIACFELASTVMPNGGNLVLAWNASGLINITA